MTSRSGSLTEHKEATLLPAPHRSMPNQECRRSNAPRGFGFERGTARAALQYDGQLRPLDLGTDTYVEVHEAFGHHRAGIQISRMLRTVPVREGGTTGVEGGRALFECAANA